MLQTIAGFRWNGRGRLWLGGGCPVSSSPRWGDMADRGGGHRLGWLGTGRMGVALIHRLLDAGCDVTVYNRTRAKAEPLAAAGAKIASTAAELGSTDIGFVTVGTSQDFIAALTGPGRLTSAGR